MPQISVIVPVYNAEKYLRRFVDSILAQTFADFELLLVDDGSTDGSGTICDEYAAKDARIRVFHKGNGGVSSARNVGLDEARGKYSIHVDSDDWIEKEMLEGMYSEIRAQHCDILISDYYLNDSTYVEQRTSSINSIEILRDILEGKLFGGLCHKLIRHSLFQHYNIHIIEGVNYCEDVLLLSQLLLCQVTVGFIHKAFYHYMALENNSITRHYSLDKYYMRKEYVFALSKILPSSFESTLRIVALRVKAEAFVAGLLPKGQMRSFIPCSNREIMRLREPLFLRAFLILSNIGLNRISMILYKKCR